ncbi:hypothetical protein N7450_009441, partial [Penicillium hetheringtonii]
MNWTGGQLRRHSAQKGILTKTQKRNFAKSRQLIDDDRLSRQEFEQFGKRRKLNDTDHKRLSTQAGKTNRGLFQSRTKARRLSSERYISHSLNQIQIHIDGRPTCPHPDSNVSSENPPSRCSSQSIRLGHQTAIEDPRLSAQLHEQTRPQNRSQKLTTYNPGSQKLTEVPRTPSTIPET